MYYFKQILPVGLIFARFNQKSIFLNSTRVQSIYEWRSSGKTIPKIEKLSR